MPVEIDEDINEQDRREYLRCMGFGEQNEALGKFSGAYIWYCRAVSSAMDATEDFAARQGASRCKAGMPNYWGKRRDK